MAPIDLALSSWSLHTEFLNERLKPVDFPQVARSMFGVRCIEFYDGDYAPDFMVDEVDEGYARKIAESCLQNGVTIACIAAVNDLTNPDEAKARRHMARLEKWARHCQILKCPVLRVNSGWHSLDPHLVDIMVLRLRELLDRTQETGVRFAIENHPETLRDDGDTFRLLAVIDKLKSDRVRACPDVGAMAPGYWRTGFERLTPVAAHVHLKPFVLETADCGVRECPIESYAPILRGILQECGYKGVLSVEYTEFQDMNAAPEPEARRTLEKAAAAFELELARPTLEFPARLRDERSVNRDAEVAPRESILALLADGCEYKLQAQVRIDDCATSAVQYSRSAVCRPSGKNGNAGGTPFEFCSLIVQDPDARQRCLRFYDERVQCIVSGDQAGPRICICPFGLMVLSVPVVDQEGTLYGAIACGPWIEEGTEGMVTLSMDQFVASQGAGRQGSGLSRDQLKRAASGVSSFTLARLRESRRVATGLANDLAALYAAPCREKAFFKKNTDVIGQLKRIALVGNLDDFISELPIVFAQLGGILGTRHIALYQRYGSPDSNRVGFVKVVPFGEGELPHDVPIDTDADRGSRRGDRAQLVEHLDGRLGARTCESMGAESDNQFLVVYVIGPTPWARYEEALAAQFAFEVESLVTSLRSLGEAQRRRKSLEEFIGNAKHSLSEPLQGIADRARGLKRLCEDNRANRDNVGPHVVDLMKYSDKAGAAVRRINREGLPAPLHLGTVLAGDMLSDSVLNHLAQAQERNLTIECRGLVELGSIQADETKLTELFDNLLDNAIKFADPYTTITVGGFSSTGCLTRPWSLKGVGQRFVVTDKGMGIPSEEMEHIFERYYRGQRHPHGKVISGTGLGLSICRDIVQAHGGQIRCRSTLESVQLRTIVEPLQVHCVEFEVDLPCTQNT